MPHSSHAMRIKIISPADKLQQFDSLEATTPSPQNAQFFNLPVVRAFSIPDRRPLKSLNTSSTDRGLSVIEPPSMFPQRKEAPHAHTCTLADIYSSSTLTVCTQTTTLDLPPNTVTDTLHPRPSRRRNRRNEMEQDQLLPPFSQDSQSSGLRIFELTHPLSFHKP